MQIQTLKSVVECVVRAIQMTPHLFCPFCAEYHLFEFMLKDHLNQLHAKELDQIALVTPSSATSIECDSISDEQFDRIKKMFSANCDSCAAIFMYTGVLTKHFTEYHSEKRTKILLSPLSIKADPTILYARCSPGLSDVFDKISVMSNENTLSESRQKGILKKTISKPSIICSPSSASVRRTMNSTLVRRSSSVQRELRFDFSDENQSPNGYINPPNAALSHHSNRKSPRRRKKKPKRTKNYVRNLFFFKNCAKIQQESPKRIVTSTPINELGNSDGTTLMPIPKYVKSKSSSDRYRNKPLFALLERFQCAHCKRTWENNDDLLIHVNEVHKHERRWFQTDYKCAACSAKFFCNRFLVRHCHSHHTSLNRML